jgi:hypothetical protein
VAAPYIYIPSYGIERYKKSNNGAEETNDNLLITLWQVIDSDPVLLGDLFIQNYARDNVPVAEQPAYEQAFKSRDSARFYFKFVAPPNPPTLFAVLNPSQEYQQKMVDAIVYNGGPVALLSSYMIKKSLQSNYVWDVFEQLAPTGRNVYAPGADLNATFSTYLDLGASAAPLAFLKTNGADGNTPEFFDRSTSDGVKEMIAAVNKGDFYVGMIISAQSETDGGYITIKYPHSVARG